MKINYFLFLSGILFCLVNSCKKGIEPQKKPFKIAFFADVHLQDIYTEFEQNSDFKTSIGEEARNYANVRSMASQLKSTRLLNENYFAFIAALDDAVSKNIKTIVLPGDFTDDGQPRNIKAIKKIFQKYSKNHGLRFFITTGNHDPVRPFTREAGKSNFLSNNGSIRTIVSSKELAKENYSEGKTPIISSEIKNWGYQEILSELANFGFFPKKKYHYWETPFSTYSYEDYNFYEATKQAKFENRKYKTNRPEVWLPDASYLVEEEKDIWLLAIDANAYVPKKGTKPNSKDPNDFSNASAGYRTALSQKSHLIPWIKKIAGLAKEKGKTLIAFSHYPTVDYYDGAASEIQKLFGTSKMQLKRLPSENVARLLANSGVQIHFGGHMHINDTGIYRTKKGNTLFNIQTPSLAAYPPAYKVLSIQESNMLEIQTIVLNDVPSFKALFPLYEQEYTYLKESDSSQLWNRTILKAKNYKDYTYLHLIELVRTRFLPRDWPPDFLNTLKTLSGKDLLLSNKKDILDQHLDAGLSKSSLNISDFEAWSGMDMILDFYRLNSADELAFGDIGTKRITQYRLVCEVLKHSEEQLFTLWGSLFLKAMQGEPADHFTIDLNTGTIERVKS